ncbi:FtsX-like permease family protein [Pseudoxanthomonas sp. CF385]|uniref:ABC transporter permease n=1 Tax=Pseudoxanthomonas sp. CF385 TaxID=1881042 RepID=UPI000881BAE1|nr:ABC transporter permease [Pseudoxanthomonas sp. CF385]SDR18505.1 FtsX-like permease family protein [Pseudoxanthomonas sp. CF385]
MSPPFLLLGRHHAGTWLIALQLAIGVVLCLQAWQAVTGLHAARAMPDGIDDAGLLLVPWLQMTPGSDPGVADVVRRLRNVPGVQSATAANQAPYGNSAWSMHVWMSARPAERHVVSVFLGDERFAWTLGLATVRGREFLPDEFRDYAGDQTDLHAALGPAIISSALARRLYGDADPLGRTVWTAPGARLHVVGVIDRVPPPASARDTGDLAMLLPVRMVRAGDAQFLVRHTGDADGVASRIRTALAAAYPSMAVADPVGMTSLREASLHAPRMRARWSVGACVAWWFSTLGLLMLGGERWVQAHAQEFSLRRAAGATGRQLARRLRCEYLGLACMAVMAGLTCGGWLLPRVAPDGLVSTPSMGAMLAAAAWATLAVQFAATWPARLARRIPPHLVSRSPSVRL